MIEIEYKIGSRDELFKVKISDIIIFYYFVLHLFIRFIPLLTKEILRLREVGNHGQDFTSIIDNMSQQTPRVL